VTDRVQQRGTYASTCSASSDVSRKTALRPGRNGILDRVSRATGRTVHPDSPRHGRDRADWHVTPAAAAPRVRSGSRPEPGPGGIDCSPPAARAVRWPGPRLRWA